MKEAPNDDLSFTFNGEIPPTVPDGETYQIQFISCRCVCNGWASNLGSRPRPSQEGNQESSRGSRRMP
jgi:hypothetical protein